MGLFSFIKEAGEKLFSHGEAKQAQAAVAAAPTPENIQALSKAAGEAIATYIGTMNLNVEALDISFDAPSGAVTVAGVALGGMTPPEATAARQKELPVKATDPVTVVYGKKSWKVPPADIALSFD